MFLIKDITRWGSNTRPLGLESSILPLSHIRWNDATLDLLNREHFARFILTLSDKELTFYDHPHFFCTRSNNNQRGTIADYPIVFYNRNCNLKSLSTSEWIYSPGFTKIPAFNHFNLVDICSQIVNLWPGWFIDIHFFPKKRYFPLINLKYLAFFLVETNAYYKYDVKLFMEDAHVACAAVSRSVSLIWYATWPFFEKV